MYLVNNEPATFVLCRYGVTREPAINRQMLGLMARELTLVDAKARRHVAMLQL